jgi:hypothetical protein
MAALVGVQLKFTQKPPRCIRSAMATLMPCCTTIRAKGDGGLAASDHQNLVIFH